MIASCMPVFANRNGRNKSRIQRRCSAFPAHATDGQTLQSAVEPNLQGNFCHNPNLHCTFVASVDKGQSSHLVSQPRKSSCNSRTFCNLGVLHDLVVVCLLSGSPQQFAGFPACLQQMEQSHSAECCRTLPESRLPRNGWRRTNFHQSLILCRN